MICRKNGRVSGRRTQHARLPSFLAIIGTKPKLSYLSTLIRYEELYAINPAQSRATPKEHHYYIVEHLVDNLRELKREQLFDQIQIYQRDRTYPWC